MAQNKIKTLRKLSLDEVNSIEFISGRSLKKTVCADDTSNTERQHTILDKYNGTVIVKTKDEIHQITRHYITRDIIDDKRLKENHPDIYSQYARKIEFKTITIKTIKQ